MASIYQLKPRFQALLRPAVQRLYDRGVTANQVTVTAAVVSLLVGLLLAALPHITWLFILVPIWMLLRMALNAVDGMLAREFGQQSTLGAYLNELCDVIADAALYLPFALLAGVSPALVVLVVLCATFSEYAGVMGPLAGASRRYDGPMGKSDRAFAFGVLGTGVAFGLLDGAWINGLLLTAGMREPVIVFVGIIVWGWSFGGASTQMQTAAADAAGSHVDVAQAMVTTAWNLAIASGGVIGGLLLDNAGAVSFPWALLALMAVAFLCAYFAKKHAFRPGARNHY